MKYMEQKKYDSAVIQFRKACRSIPVMPKPTTNWPKPSWTAAQPGSASKSSASRRTRSQQLQGPARAGRNVAAGAIIYKAEEQARYVIEHDPNNPEGYVLLGNVLLAQKHHQDAVDAFSKAIASSPAIASAYLNRGDHVCLYEAGCRRRSRFREGHQLDPTSLPAYANLAGYYLYKKDPKKAEETFQDEIANNPISRFLTCGWPD